jgi:hypothetical protein
MDIEGQEFNTFICESFLLQLRCNKKDSQIIKKIGYPFDFVNPSM